MNQYKNEYLFSGALLHMNVVTVKKYENKDGETIEKRERIFYVRNKVSKFGKWRIRDVEFHATPAATKDLEMMRIGIELVVSFSIDVINYKDKKTGEWRRWQKLTAFSVISPTEKFKSKDWWLHNDGDPIRKKKEEDDPVEKMSHKEQRRRNPDDVEYDIKTYDKSTDYSHDGSEPLKTETKKPVSDKNPEPQNNLPF